MCVIPALYIWTGVQLHIYLRELPPPRELLRIYGSVLQSLTVRSGPSITAGTPHHPTSHVHAPGRSGPAHAHEHRARTPHPDSQVMQCWSHAPGVRETGTHRRPPPRGRRRCAPSRPAAPCREGGGPRAACAALQPCNARRAATSVWCRLIPRGILCSAFQLASTATFTSIPHHRSARPRPQDTLRFRGPPAEWPAGSC